MCTRGCELALTFLFHILSFITCKLIWSVCVCGGGGGGGGGGGYSKILDLVF